MQSGNEMLLHAKVDRVELADQQLFKVILFYAVMFKQPNG
jgi:hypothetical protein